jgi:hypothetical protein
MDLGAKYKLRKISEKIPLYSITVPQRNSAVKQETVIMSNKPNFGYNCRFKKLVEKIYSKV